MNTTEFRPERFPNDHLAEECRFVLTQDIDSASNFDGIVVIDSQYNLMCGGHAVNNLLQYRRIDRCQLKNRADIDEVVEFIKQADRDLQVYSCDKPIAIRLFESDPTVDISGLPLQNKSDHIYKNPEIALENIKRNLGLVIGFIEFDGRHYVCWVRSDNGYWYRIDSMYRGTTGNMGGSVCKFTTENMLRYVELLPEVPGNEIFKGGCRLLVVTFLIFEGLQGSSFRRERELPPLQRSDSFGDFVSASVPRAPPTYEEMMRLYTRNQPIPTQHQEDDGWASPLPIKYNKKSRKGKKR